MNTRRDFIKYATMTGGAVAASSVSSNLMASIPEAVIQTEVTTMPPLEANSGQHYHPVVTPNGWTLPFRMRNNVKEFHLIAEPVVCLLYTSPSPRDATLSRMPSSP